MPVPAAVTPYEICAEAIIAVIGAEFAAEQFTAIHDKLHESLGRWRVDIGVSPEREAPQPRNRVVQETRILVQFYDLWTEEINPDTQVDPRKIAGYADRFRRALKAAQATFGASSEVWYFDVEEITYPDDPTGNKTRFHAIIRAYGNNDALVETTG